MAVNVFHQDALDNAYIIESAWRIIRRRYEAARVIQSFVAIITIPLTSAVCANAAVIFAQKHTPSNGLTLRQLLVLADESWANPAKWPRIVVHWRRYASGFFLAAVLLNILGAILVPASQAFLSLESIHGHDGSDQINYLFDLADLEHVEGLSVDNNRVALLTRNALGAVYTAIFQPQAQL